jgi:hypothetical protein
MKHQAYYTRALKARDPRFARIFGKLGYQTTALVADNGDGDGIDLPALRDEYERAVGKRPFNGWDAAKLIEKIAEAKRD